MNVWGLCSIALSVYAAVWHPDLDGDTILAVLIEWWVGGFAFSFLGYTAGRVTERIKKGSNDG